MRRSDFIRIKERIVSQYRGMNDAVAQDLILERIPQRPRTLEQKVEAAILRILWVQKDRYEDFRTCRNHLSKALKIANLLCEENHLLAPLRRDIQICLGIIYSRQSLYSEARKYFSDAIYREKNRSRLVIGASNLARSLMHEGRFCQALYTVDRFDLAQQNNPNIFLLKSRILYLLGCKNLAISTMSKFAADLSSEIEYEYLNLQVNNGPWDVRMLLTSYHSFIESLERKDATKEANFYELEASLIRAIADPLSISNKHSFLVRCRYLCRHGGSAHLSVGIEPALSLKSPDPDIMAIGSFVCSIRNSSHRIIFPLICILVIEVLVKARRYNNIPVFLNELKSFYRYSEEGFSGNVRQRLRAEPKPIRNYLDHLTDQIPDSKMEDFDRIGMNLFS